MEAGSLMSERRRFRRGCPMRWRMVSFAGCFQSVVLFSPLLIATPVEPVVLIEYQAKCNYGWNSCFVGANNLPWRGTQRNGNEGDRMKGVPREAQCGGPRSRKSPMRYQNFDNPIDYQCNNWWPSRRKGAGWGISGHTRIRFEVGAS